MSSLKYVHFLDKQTNRDVRLLDLLGKLSCLLEASAALLGQVQVCIDSGDKLRCRTSGGDKV